MQPSEDLQMLGVSISKFLLRGCLAANKTLPYSDRGSSGSEAATTIIDQVFIYNDYFYCP